MQLQLKQVKTAGGEETLRFTASIYLDRLKIAIVSNSGTGGDHQYDYFGHDNRKIFEDYIDRLRTETLNLFDPLERKINNWLKNFQARFNDFQQKDIDCDVIIDCQIELQDEIKMCKKKTVFRLSQDNDNEYRIINKLFSPELEAWIVNEYGSDIVIINKIIMVK